MTRGKDEKKGLASLADSGWIEKYLEQTEGPDEPISESEGRMMAYLDDELDDPGRRTFEAELREDRGLQRELARFRALAELTRTVYLPGPTDREIHRFWAGFYNRTEWQIGWFLLLFGGVLLGGWAIWELLTLASIPIPVKIAMASIVLGGALLLGNTIRLRQRMARHDRYRGVME